MPHIRFNDWAYETTTEQMEEIMESLEKAANPGGYALIQVTERDGDQIQQSQLLWTPGTPISFHHWDLDLS